MKLSDFDFELPEDAIALRPCVPRDAARLLVVHRHEPGPFAGMQIRDLRTTLRRGDLLVLNDTKVVPAQLHGRRKPRIDGDPEIPVSITLMERESDGRWKAFAKPGRRLDPGDMLQIGTETRVDTVIVDAKGHDGTMTLRGASAALDDIMTRHGVMPLPAYIAKKRDADARDTKDYQTVYAVEAGAVAAPTAGLHFTSKLLDDLRLSGIDTVFVTLHVGAGTFLPVKSEWVSDHEMHAEFCHIDEHAARAINRARAKGGRIIAVGTTSLRTLEAATGDDGTVHPFTGTTRLFITPGYTFRSADALLTNFHLPKSTLFMLVCAFCGVGTMKAAYMSAIAAGYRFYSYGDACLLFRDSE